MRTEHGYVKAPDTGETLLSAFLTEVRPTRRAFTAHHHNYLEIALFRRGGGTYSIGNRAYPIAPGDIFLFSTDEMHFVSDITSDIEAVTLHFAPCFIWSPGDHLFDYSYLKVFFERGDSFVNRIPGDSSLAAELAPLIQDIDNECLQGKEHYELMVKIKLLTVLLTLLRAFPSSEEKAPPVSVGVTGVSAVQAALDYINEHYTTDVTLDALAAHAGVSRSYLSALFKRLNGMTIWNYILIRRVDLAKHYLTKTDRSMMEVATDCGFNTAANFNKIFKSLTAQTPSAYRATHKITPR